MQPQPYPANPVPSVVEAGAIGVAGINLGFGFCKLVLDGTEHIFMSALTPLNKGVEGLAQRTPERVNVVSDVDGRLYEAGVDGVLNSTEEPLKVLSREWGRTKHYRLLMGAVLNRMAATGKRRWVVVTGLAADHIRDAEYRNMVARLWSGLQGQHRTALGDIEVVGARVLPETAGGFMALTREPEMDALVRASTGAVIDFGRMTVNWLPFRNGQTDGNRLGSVDVGVSNVILEATTLVRAEARKPDLHPLDVEAAMLGIRPIHKLVEATPGKLEPRQIDMTVPLARATAEVWPRIEQALSNNLGDLRGKLLIAIGGGARVFGDLLRESYPGATVLLPDNGQMTNARGLYQVGCTELKARGLA